MLVEHLRRQPGAQLSALRRREGFSEKTLHEIGAVSVTECSGGQHWTRVYLSREQAEKYEDEYAMKHLVQNF